MNGPAKYAIRMYTGDTFSLTIRWETQEKVYCDISSISKTAPVEVTTSTPHNLPQGWRAKIYGAAGMREINSEEYHVVDVTSASSISINDINSKLFSTYTGGGTLEYNKPLDLANYSARMQVRKNIRSDVSLELSSQTGEIVLDNTLKTITITADNVNLNFSSGVYSLELTNSVSGEVSTLLEGSVRIMPEITR